MRDDNVCCDNDNKLHTIHYTNNVEQYALGLVCKSRLGTQAIFALSDLLVCFTAYFEYFIGQITRLIISVRARVCMCVCVCSTFKLYKISH